MRPDSKELATRIDAEVAYQNGEDMQFRSRTGGSWIDLKEGGTLSFNWAASEFRATPKAREGWIDSNQLHEHSSWECDVTECIHVREIL